MNESEMSEEFVVDGIRFEARKECPAGWSWEMHPSDAKENYHMPWRSDAFHIYQTVALAKEAAERMVRRQRKLEFARREERFEAQIGDAAKEGDRLLVWEKIKDRFIPCWDELMDSLDESERNAACWAALDYITKPK